MNFKINSRPLFTIIFKLKNGNFKTRDVSSIIERVLAGEEGIKKSMFCHWILHQFGLHIEKIYSTPKKKIKNCRLDGLIVQ